MKKVTFFGGPFLLHRKRYGEKVEVACKDFLRFFGVCVGLMGIGTFTQVNGIASAVTNFL